jgi:hypothetical protein
MVLRKVKHCVYPTGIFDISTVKHPHFVYVKQHYVATGVILIILGHL